MGLTGWLIFTLVASAVGFGWGHVQATIRNARGASLSPQEFTSFSRQRGIRTTGWILGVMWGIKFLLAASADVRFSRTYEVPVSWWVPGVPVLLVVALVAYVLRRRIARVLGGRHYAGGEVPSIPIGVDEAGQTVNLSWSPTPGATGYTVTQQPAAAAYGPAQRKSDASWSVTPQPGEDPAAWPDEVWRRPQ